MTENPILTRDDVDRWVQQALAAKAEKKKRRKAGKELPEFTPDISFTDSQGESVETFIAGEQYFLLIDLEKTPDFDAALFAYNPEAHIQLILHSSLIRFGNSTYELYPPGSLSTHYRIRTSFFVHGANLGYVDGTYDILFGAKVAKSGKLSLEMQNPLAEKN